MANVPFTWRDRWGDWPNEEILFSVLRCLSSVAFVPMVRVRKGSKNSQDVSRPIKRSLRQSVFLGMGASNRLKRQGRAQGFDT